MLRSKQYLHIKIYLMLEALLYYYLAEVTSSAALAISSILLSVVVFRITKSGTEYTPLTRSSFYLVFSNTKENLVEIGEIAPSSWPKIISRFLSRA